MGLRAERQVGYEAGALAGAAPALLSTCPRGLAGKPECCSGSTGCCAVGWGGGGAGIQKGALSWGGRRGSAGAAVLCCAVGGSVVVRQGALCCEGQGLLCWEGGRSREGVQQGHCDVRGRWCCAVGGRTGVQ